MSNLIPLNHNAQLHYKPADHTFVTVDDTIPFYAQASYPVNQFPIPPYNNIALTNNADGNPLTAVYSKNSTTVATLTFTYDGDGYMTNAAISYPA